MADSVRDKVEPVSEKMLISLVHGSGPFREDQIEIINWLANRELYRRTPVSPNPTLHRLLVRAIRQSAHNCDTAFVTPCYAPIYLGTNHVPQSPIVSRP